MTDKRKNTQEKPQADGARGAPVRDSAYEVLPQRSGARIRVRYREGSISTDCRLCR